MSKDVNYSAKYADAKKFAEPEPDLLRVDELGHCKRCGVGTDWMDLEIGSYVCSEKCRVASRLQLQSKAVVHSKFNAMSDDGKLVCLIFFGLIVGFVVGAVLGGEKYGLGLGIILGGVGVMLAKFLFVMFGGGCPPGGGTDVNNPSV